VEGGSPYRSPGGGRPPLAPLYFHESFWLLTGFYAGQRGKGASLDKKGVASSRQLSQRAWLNFFLESSRKLADYTRHHCLASGVIQEAAETGGGAEIGLVWTS